MGAFSAKHLLLLSTCFFVQIIPADDWGGTMSEQNSPPVDDTKWLDRSGKEITVGAIITTDCSDEHMKVIELATETIPYPFGGSRIVAYVKYQPHPLPDNYYTILGLSAERVTIVAQTESLSPEGDA